LRNYAFFITLKSHIASNYDINLTISYLLTILQYYISHKKELLKKNNKEHVQEQNKDLYEKNKESRLEYAKEWYANNVDKRKEYMKAYRLRKKNENNN
jgi:hypothetical protein